MQASTKPEHGDVNVEHVYRRVADEICKAIKVEDYDRAHSMASRAADGHPKVMQKLIPDIEAL